MFQSKTILNGTTYRYVCCLRKIIRKTSVFTTFQPNHPPHTLLYRSDICNSKFQDKGQERNPKICRKEVVCIYILLLRTRLTPPLNSRLIAITNHKRNRNSLQGTVLREQLGKFQDVSSFREILWDFFFLL